MNFVERAIRRPDGLQHRHGVPAFLFAITKKFGDDNAGALTVQITYRQL